MEMSPDDLFSKFGHIGSGKKMKKPEIQQAAEHQYESEVDVSADKLFRATIVWKISVESKEFGIGKIMPVVPNQKVGSLEITDPKIEIIVSEQSVESLALVPFEVEIHGKMSTVRFYGG